jgi:glycosyltransferase involved in cell wall biosynthesis
MGIPTIVTLHELVELADLRTLNAPGGVFAPVGARLLTQLATNADHVCLTMQHYAEWLSARNVDCTHIPIGSYQNPERLKENEKQGLLFFTTLAPFKGLELLLTAFRELSAEFPLVTLTIAGAEHARFPGYAQELKNQCAGISNIEWLGQVPEEKVKDLFEHAKVVILPYTASTGSSSVLYQSATWGRSIVASNLSEHLYLANENDLQIQFFKTGDAQSLKDAICAQLNSPELRNQQTSHNFKSIQKLTPAVTSRHYIQAFNLALKKHGSAKQINSANTLGSG